MLVEFDSTFMFFHIIIADSCFSSFADCDYEDCIILLFSVCMLAFYLP